MRLPISLLRFHVISKFRTLHMTGVRGILSEAYLCDESWQKRLQNPLLKDIQMDQFFIETDKKFGTKRLVSGVEIDMFANNIQEESRLDELEHLLYRFRKTKRALEMMESTNYAVIRSFLNFKAYDGLMRILNDRESYGVFPDLIQYNILMSTFLKEKMYSEAARIATLMMLQENFENKISCILGLYSCQKFLNECSLDSLIKEEEIEEEEVVEKKDEDDEEEDIKLVRVPFLRNPWFDDHFEITDPKHLIGKTFYLLGRELPNACGRSYQLIGLAMYEKWNKVHALVKSFLESDDASIMSETIEKVNSCVGEIPDDENKSKEKWTKTFDEQFREMKAKNKINDGVELMKSIESELKDVLKYEKDDIELQKKLFSDWDEERKLAFEKQNAELEKERRLKAIEEKKEYLLWKEKLLFFFENEDKNLEEEQKINEMVASLKLKKDVEEVYFPPEMTKKRMEKLTKYQKLIRVKKI